MPHFRCFTGQSSYIQSGVVRAGNVVKRGEWNYFKLMKNRKFCGKKGRFFERI
jgi:hypothetical protein